MRIVVSQHLHTHTSPHRKSLKGLDLIILRDQYGSMTISNINMTDTIERIFGLLDYLWKDKRSGYERYCFFSKTCNDRADNIKLACWRKNIEDRECNTTARKSNRIGDFFTINGDSDNRR